MNDEEYRKQTVIVRDLGRTGITKGTWADPRIVKDLYRPAGKEREQPRGFFARFRRKKD